MKIGDLGGLLQNLLCKIPPSDTTLFNGLVNTWRLFEVVTYFTIKVGNRKKPFKNQNEFD